PMRRVMANPIQPFNARGMCRVYSRRDVYRELSADMDVWRAHDGRLLIRFVACTCNDVDSASYEVIGFLGPRPGQQWTETKAERWVPRSVRDEYDKWITYPRWGALLYWKRVGPENRSFQVEPIPWFDARGMRRLYNRSEHFGTLALRMDVWQTRDGRVLARF